MIDNDPVVSVVVPVFNVELWLADCIDSITNQTLHNIEIILINDGSTDHSVDVLKRKSASDDRIRIINQQHKGLSEARNAGAHMAKGKYLYFMDGDDLLDITALELCTKKMEQQNLELLCFNMEAFGDNSKYDSIATKKNSIWRNRSLNEEKIYTGQEMFAELWKKHVFSSAVWSCIILRSAFIKNKLWFHPGIIHEDMPWMFAVLMSLSHCGFTKQVFYYHRIRNNSIIRHSPDFFRTYSFFIGFQDVLHTCLNYPQLFAQENYKSLLISYFQVLQKKTIRLYRTCSEEEKRKRVELNQEKRLLFEQLVVFPASIMDTINKQKEQYHKLIGEADKIKQNYISIKESHSFRFGRMITYLPRKIRCLRKRLAKKKYP